MPTHCTDSQEEAAESSRVGKRRAELVLVECCHVDFAQQVLLVVHLLQHADLLSS